MTHTLIILALVPFALLGCLVLTGLIFVFLRFIRYALVMSGRRKRDRKIETARKRENYKVAARIRNIRYIARYGSSVAMAIRIVQSTVAWLLLMLALFLTTAFLLLIPAAVIMITVWSGY